MSGVNSLARKIATKTVVEDASKFVSSAISFDQGDLLYMDTTNHLIKKLAAETDGATFLGIAPVTIVSGKYPSVYNTAVDASVGTPALPGPEYGDVHKVLIKAGEVLTPGCALYADPATGSRNVQASGTKQVGVYQGAAQTVPTGGATIEMLVGCRFPNDTLKF